MINPKNKRVQVTLPGETTELLESLSIRYNKSNSEIVKWAINVLAARKSHNIVIKLREQNENTKNNNNSTNNNIDTKSDNTDQDNSVVEYFIQQDKKYLE